jgi:hypothetical protein
MSEISDVVIKLKADASIFKTEMKAAASAASGADDAMKKMAEDAKQIFNETRTPVEKFRLEVARLSAMFKAGAIDVDLYTRSMNKTQATLAAAQKQANTLQKLKSGIGDESAFAGVAKIALGVGAVGVVSMLTGKMAGMAEKGKEWAEAMQSGAMSSADVGLALAKSLPIIGNLVRTAIALADAMSPVGVDYSNQYKAASDLATQAKRERDMSAATGDIERQRVEEMQRYSDVKAKILKQERDTTEASKNATIRRPEDDPFAFTKSVVYGKENLQAEYDAKVLEHEKAQAIVKQGARQAEDAAEETHLKKMAEIDKAAADLKAKSIAEAEAKAKQGADAKRASDQKAADEAKRSWDSIQDRIKKLGEEVKSPIEVYKDAMKELQSLKKFGLGEDVFQKQAAKLEADLLGPTKEVSMAGYQTLEQGYARIAQSAATRGGDSIASQQLKVQQETREQMKAAIAATKEGSDKVVNAISKTPAKFAA